MKNVNLSVGLSGRFRLQVRGPDGELRKDTGWFNNLILNTGLNRIGTGSSVGARCQVGAGSTAPTVADTSLQSWIAGNDSTQSQTNGIVNAAGETYSWARRTYRFNIGVAAGNVSEVGVGWGSSGATLFSRALVLDGSGNPNTITVLSDEILDVTYELRFYPPSVDAAFSLTIAGVNYDFVARTALLVDDNWSPQSLLGSGMGSPSINAYQGPIGAITAQPTGGGSLGSMTYDSYSNNSYQRTGIATFNVSSGNLSGGIGALLFRTSGSWAMQFSVTPKIPKDNTKTFTIRVTTTWARKTL